MHRGRRIERETNSSCARLLPRQTSVRHRLISRKTKMVTVLEVQTDFSVRQCEAFLKFPRGSKSRLYIVTNKNTKLHLLNHSVGSPRSEEGGDSSHQRNIFRHGVSTNVFAITEPTGTASEVRLLLSPSEISRLSSNFNLIGFVTGCLTMKKYQDSLLALCEDHTRHEDDVQELCKAASQFLSYSEDKIVNEYCRKLNGILKKVGAHCNGREKTEGMVVGALVALVAAEVASSVKGTRSFDYKVEKEKTQEDQSEQIQKMIKVFDVMVDLLTVPLRGKRVQILFRNPCPDNWASGGKKLVDSGETFVFGLCHKVVSISEAESEIQFLQNLQESYDLVSVFHLPAFVEHLLMTTAWRKKIEHFLKEQDQRKKMIHELSSLAESFICSSTGHQKAFSKEFETEMLEKWSNVEVFLAGDEVVCTFAILVAILAAVTAKSSVDKCIPNSEKQDPEELAADRVDTNGSAALEMNVSAGSSSISIECLDSYEVIGKKVTEVYGGEHCDLSSSPDDWGKIVDVGAESSTNDSGTTDHGSINGSLKSPEPPAEPPGVRTIDTTDQETDNDNAEYPRPRDCAHGSSPVIGASDQESTNASLKTPEPPAEPPGVRTLDTTDQETDNDNAEYPRPRDCAHGSSPVIGASDQESINASLKTPEPPAEPPGVRTLDFTDQETENDDAEYPGVRNWAHGSSPTSPETGGTLHSQGSGGGLSLDDSNDDGAYRVAQPPSVGARDNAPETQGSSSRNRISSTSFIGLMFLLVVAAMLSSGLPQSMISVLVAITLGLLVVKWLMSWS